MQAVSVNHYENFPVASWLCPAHLRPAVQAIYWFARTADDLADEGDASAEQRLADLNAYRAALAGCAAGAQPSEPRWAGVFAPLGPIIREYQLPLPLLTDLLSAFEQDVVQKDYTDRAELLDYCRRSANPVGRLLLHLYGVNDAVSLQQSDAICSALQLANFWQDFSVDLPRGRVYAPRTDCERFGVTPAELLRGHDSPAARALVAELVGWARELMSFGAPLVHRLPGRAGWELRLVVQGGWRILERIEALAFASVLTRPHLGPRDLAVTGWRALTMRPGAALPSLIRA
jgi:squalene synthase HpnC